MRFFSVPYLLFTFKKCHFTEIALPVFSCETIYELIFLVREVLSIINKDQHGGQIIKNNGFTTGKDPS